MTKYIYTFPKWQYEESEIEQYTKDDCIEKYACDKCDRIELDEFANHHNKGYITNLNDCYILIF